LGRTSLFAAASGDQCGYRSSGTQQHEILLNVFHLFSRKT
jgi:hypothetical protein